MPRKEKNMKTRREIHQHEKPLFNSTVFRLADTHSIESEFVPAVAISHSFDGFNERQYLFFSTSHFNFCLSVSMQINQINQE